MSERQERVVILLTTFLFVLLCIAAAKSAVVQVASSALLHNASVVPVRYCPDWGPLPESGCSDPDPSNAPVLAPGETTPAGRDADGYWVDSGQVSGSGTRGPAWVKVPGWFGTTFDIVVHPEEG